MSAPSVASFLTEATAFEETSSSAVEEEGVREALRVLRRGVTFEPLSSSSCSLSSSTCSLPSLSSCLFFCCCCWSCSSSPVPPSFPSTRFFPSRAAPLPASAVLPLTAPPCSSFASAVVPRGAGGCSRDAPPSWLALVPPPFSPDTAAASAVVAVVASAVASAVVAVVAVVAAVTAASTEGVSVFSATVLPSSAALRCAAAAVEDDDVDDVVDVTEDVDARLSAADGDGGDASGARSFCCRSIESRKKEHEHKHRMEGGRGGVK